MLDRLTHMGTIDGGYAYTYMYMQIPHAGSAFIVHIVCDYAPCVPPLQLAPQALWFKAGRWRSCTAGSSCSRHHHHHMPLHTTTYHLPPTAYHHHRERCTPKSTSHHLQLLKLMQTKQVFVLVMCVCVCFFF